MDKKRILVVDDQKNAREGLTQLLIKEGYEVVAAATGAVALNMVKKQDFDLIITDLMMPEVSGLDILGEIAEKKLNIDVIIVTAYGEVNSYLKAMTLGAFDYLNKPIKVKELHHIINEALNHSYA
ncbi:MAG: response regulator [bacterium]